MTIGHSVGTQFYVSLCFYVICCNEMNDLRSTEVPQRSAEQGNVSSKLLHLR